MNKERVKAVHDQDLERLLDRLGILNKFKQGKLKCKFCKAAITSENLHSIFPQSGNIKVVCDRIECVKELSNLLREGMLSL